MAFLELIFKKKITDEDMEPKEIDIPVPQETVPVPPKPDYIHLWALAIQEFEGYSPGSASYRRNNPGNCKGLDGYFKTFPTYEAGFAYLEDYLTRACTGKHKAYSPNMTLRQFFSVYAPDGNRIIDNYSSFVATKLGVFPSIKIKELV